MNSISMPRRWPLVLALALAAPVAAADQPMRVANEGTIGDKWMLAEGTTLASAQYPAYFAPRGDNVCVALVYTINIDGKTSDFAMAKAWNSEAGESEPVQGFWSAFADAAAAAVSQWRFKPRPEVASPVRTRTVATIGFNGTAGVDGGELRGHCRIADLDDTLRHLKASAFERGDINKNAAEHDRMELERQLMRDSARRAGQGGG